LFRLTSKKARELLVVALNAADEKSMEELVSNEDLIGEIILGEGDIELEDD
jgi:hypothetical protein